jgi:NAD-dependent deacetylase
LIRPDVVWFGEALDNNNLAASLAAAEVADVFLIVGTSGLVQPAASFPNAAKRCGARLIEINPEQTPLTDSVDVFLKGASGVILPQLMESLKR